MEAKVIATNNYDIVQTKDIPPPTTTATTAKSWWTTTRIRITIGCCISAIGLAVGLGVGLGMMKKNNSTELKIPFLKPPVFSASPQGLKGSRRLRTENFNRQLVAISTADATATIKSRLYSAGPGDFSYRLGMVDGRLQEIKNRAKESEKPKECLSVAALKFDPVLPNNEAFPMYFSCKEEMTGGQLSVYFGQKDDKYYVAELQKGGNVPGLGNIPSIAVLASVDSAGNKVDVWQIVVDDTLTPKTVSVFHINADKVANTIQVITASSSSGTGVGCGVKMSSGSTAMWVYGKTTDNNSPNACPTDATANDYINSVVNGDWESYCVSPVTLLDISISECSALSTNFPLADFSYAQIVANNYGNDAYSLIFNPAMPSGLVDFKK